jgi:secondary thiamine-phosphate synthase enzyme
MAVAHKEVSVATRGPGTYEVTGLLVQALRDSGLRSGVATVFCQHTSCSLVVMENASPEARRDLQRYLDKLVPPDPSFEHSLEGEDDMPSHIKMALTRTSESVPFDGGELLLGTWQGVYLWEHRDHPHRRILRITLVGE